MGYTRVLHPVRKPMFAAMKINKIDALGGSPPNGQQAETQDLGKILGGGRSSFPA